MLKRTPTTGHPFFEFALTNCRRKIPFVRCCHIGVGLYM
jgi:hypothetical protein